MAAAAAAVRRRRINPLRALRVALQARTARWVRRRQGADLLPVELGRRRLYILPTRGGLAFGALVFVMLLAGLNYANSLALFLTFLLAAFALVVMQLCHRNLLGVEVIALQAPPVFAARAATLLVTLGNPSAAPRLRVAAGLEGAPRALADIGAHSRVLIKVPLAPQSRGVSADRARADHHGAPVWAVPCLDLGARAAGTGGLPGADRSRPPPHTSAHKPGTRAPGGAGVDEWLGLRPFRDGDSPRQVDWKAYAREAPLMVKEYQPVGSDLRWFDFAQLTGLDTEARLAQLARWVVDAKPAGSATAWHCRACACRALAGPSTGIAVLCSWRASQRRTHARISEAHRVVSEPEPLAPKSLAWACAAFAGGLLLHVDRVPLWARLTCAALILWRLAAVREGLWLPGPLLRSRSPSPWPR